MRIKGEGTGSTERVAELRVKQEPCEAAEIKTMFDEYILNLKCVLLSGIIYDVIVEPPSVGSMTDEHGHQRPVAFLAYR